ncbi:alpha/beta fold hydrolase [Pseudooceanicola sp. HF7]|uniref:alpha/beta fold hydrolase n=1 Tax=Pseudooceanicola sp. HF7 TaxID=2721560 RepID=UPI001430E9CE|nr:alpha/beta hydrolase [Pseudooceanicola sp. HF7]NIZ10878.1 alpha/beta hydrolase [Pseudooceanicola sp. HF7]
MTQVTVVLVPGLVSDARVWKPVAEALAPRYPIHDADVRQDSSIPGMAHRILQQVDGPLVVIGHSMGGRVAMEMAHQAPDRLRALVLANTGHDAKKPGEEAKRQAKIDLANDDMEKLAAEWLPPMLDPARTGDTALMQDLTEMVLSIGPVVHERQIRALVDRPDAGTYISEITCPILLVTGAQDGWSPEPQHREIADLAPDAEVHVIDQAGHFLPLEQSAQTVALITEWLDRRREDIHV